MITEKEKNIIQAINKKANFNMLDQDNIWDIYINIFIHPPGGFIKKCDSCINEMLKQINDQIELENNKTK